MLTTNDFLQLYDCSNNTFGEDLLHDMFWGEFLDDENVKEIETVTGELNRWTHPVKKVYKIQDRYFCFCANLANTEYQEDYFDIQPYEVKPVEKVIIVWEAV